MLTVGRMMLWEAWRLTWQSLFLRVLVVSLVAIILVHLSRQRVNGNGQNMVLFAVFSLVSLQAVLSSLYAKFGEERPGFPFYLGFTRPVPTWLLVLVPMGYFAVSMSAMYFVPVLLLVLVFDASLPILTGSICIGLIAVICAACNWWSKDKLQRGFGWLAAYLAIQQLLLSKLSIIEGSKDMLELMTASISFEYSGLVIAAIIAVLITVFGVEKQRHGDPINLSSLVQPRSRPSVKKPLSVLEILTGLEWMKGLYSRPCPTHSPLAAEVWREMKTRGIPVIASGVFVSIIVPVLWILVNSTARDGPVQPPGMPPALLPLLFTVTIIPMSLPLFIATANLFGISKRQGRVYLSKFDATLPVTTFHQVLMRLFIAIGSLFISMAIIWITLWNATPLVVDIYDYSINKVAFTASLQAMTWIEIIQHVYVYMIQFITLTVFFGILQLLWVLYGRRIRNGVPVFLIYIVFLAVGTRNDWFSFPFIINQLWLIIGFVMLSTLYILFDNLRKTMLKTQQLAVVAGIWLLYVPAYFSLLLDSGVLSQAMPLVFIAWTVMLSMLPFTAALLAPWTVSRFRSG